MKTVVCSAILLVLLFDVSMLYAANVHKVNNANNIVNCLKVFEIYENNYDADSIPEKKCEDAWVAGFSLRNMTQISLLLNDYQYKRFEKFMIKTCIVKSKYEMSYYEESVCK